MPVFNLVVVICHTAETAMHLQNFYMLVPLNDKTYVSRLFIRLNCSYLFLTSIAIITWLASSDPPLVYIILCLLTSQAQLNWQYKKKISTSICRDFIIELQTSIEEEMTKFPSILVHILPLKSVYIHLSISGGCCTIKVDNDFKLDKQKTATIDIE